ncbi:MAG TPA: DMT family transporter, partial [Streptosporangiaceae bacterium]|nr:DMT family transporter [Streptosporangiaceae bacterium]
MTGVPEQALAMVLAFAGALSYAIASVTQQRSAAALASGRPVEPALVLRLARSRPWLLGLVGVGIGFGLQAAALAFGRLVIVEPVFPLGLLLALVLAARAEGRRLERPEWVAATAAVAGLAAFLIAAEPTGGERTAPATSLGLATAGSVVAALACWLAAARVAAPRRALVLSIA